GHGKFLSLKGTQSSGNSLCLPRTSDNHTNLTARTLPRSGFVHGGAKLPVAVRLPHHKIEVLKRKLLPLDRPVD
ncbi:hypothetical protein, partial [Rhizobium anhuiense]